MIDSAKDKNTLSYLIKNNVKFSFFGGIEFVNIASKIKTDDG